MVADHSKTSLGLEYFLWDKDEEWDWSDDRLIHFGKKECAKLGLIDPCEVEDGTVVRMEKAYPVYDESYQDRVDTVRRYLETFSNLQTIGRNGLHRYNNQDHSMLTGVYAARNVTGERNDVWAVNTEKEYLEDGRCHSRVDRLVPVPVISGVGKKDRDIEDALIEVVFARIDPLALGLAVGLVKGLILFLAVAILLLKGGERLGHAVSLLGNYVPGFEVTWTGTAIGCIEVGVMGFALGYVGACLRNGVIHAYASFLLWRAQSDARRDLLARV